jgi:hypothetical protein
LQNPAFLRTFYLSDHLFLLWCWLWSDIVIGIEWQEEIGH